MAAQIAVGLFRLNQPTDAPRDGILINALLRGLAGAEKRQQRQRRAAGIRLLAQAVALTVAIAGMVEIAEAPMAVARLMLAEPVQPGNHGGFGIDRAPFFLDQIVSNPGSRPSNIRG